MLNVIGETLNYFLRIIAKKFQVSMLRYWFIDLYIISQFFGYSSAFQEDLIEEEKKEIYI